MDETRSIDPAGLTRRGSLAALGGLLASALAARGGSAQAAVGAGSATCILTPEQTEGPYYIPHERVRRDIREGRPGQPLLLRLAVVDATGCRPLAGAAVDVWHCDAAGVYSGFGAGARSRTFMRGIQRTSARGVAEILTVYPGWYQGRTVHIHVKVHVGGSVVHTGQLYFPDSLTDVVYRRSPYRKRPHRDTRNASDAIFQQGGRQSLLALRRRPAGGYTGSITLGVRV